MNSSVSREDFLADRQGRTFADVLNDPQQPFAAALKFFNNPDRQRRMEESEIHHDRAPLAGVVRELEAVPEINTFLGTFQSQRNQRLRQAIGVLVRMIMERRGWQKTGKKGSLGVRSNKQPGVPNHNTGGLAFWFLRAERYEQIDGERFPSVRKRCKSLESSGDKRRSSNNRGANGRQRARGTDSSRPRSSRPRKAL